jgi:hypothetical protein
MYLLYTHVATNFIHVCRVWFLTALLATCSTLVSCLNFSSILKMEATFSSETSVEFQQTTRRYVPQDRALQTYYIKVDSLPFWA